MIEGERVIKSKQQDKPIVWANKKMQNRSTDAKEEKEGDKTALQIEQQQKINRDWKLYRLIPDVHTSI